MTYPLDQIALVALIMAFGSVVQGAVGFGSGLLGVPLLVLVGFSIPEAATINLTSTAVQNIAGAWKLRSHLVKSELVLPVTFRLLAIPFGTYAAYLVDQHFNLAQSKQLVGFFLLVVVSLLWGLRVKPRESLGVGWLALAFVSSGFLMGFAAMGGSPMVIYVNA
ncbi:MAG: TSUP family transporter, partial [Lacipirellulaceae bacterium]